jgi:enoyl-CoA hydratase
MILKFIHNGRTLCKRIFKMTTKGGGILMDQTCNKGENDYEGTEMWTLQCLEPVAIMTFNRPPINMMSFAALNELNQLLMEIEKERKLTAVIINSAVDGYFVAHADVDDIMRLEQGLPSVGDPDAWDWVTLRLGSMPQITVAAVDGQAWGGGCELALACTFRAISKRAHFRLLEVSKGAIPGAGGTQRLPRLIGLSKAAQIIMSCRVVEAEEALSIGLADTLVEGDFLKSILDWVAPMASMPSHSLAGAKEAILKGIDMPLAKALEIERCKFKALISSPETKAMGKKTIETEK